MTLRWIIVFVLLSHIAISQERKITVRVVESGTEKPIRDANVTIPGTSAATFSNHLGYFELAVDTVHTTLQISHISYKILQIQIPAQDRFKLYLEMDTVLLNAVNLNLYPKPAITPEIKSYYDSLGSESGATFPGGIESFYTYIGNTLAPQLPSLTEEGFTIFFTINEAGQPTGLTVSDPVVSDVITQAFQKMPAWISATQRQKSVKQMFKIPVNRFDPKSINMNSLITYINRSIKYPAQARRLGIEGVIYVEFSSDADGNASNINLLSQLDQSCNMEAIRIVSILPTNIIKSLYDQTQYHKFLLPLVFSLEEKPLKKIITPPQTNALMLPAVTVMAGKLTVQRREIHGSSSMSMQPEDITYLTLSEAVKKGNSVKKLSLSNNMLTEFPTDILSLKNLYFLDLENNQLPLIPSEIDVLRNLKELYLLQNQLVDLPANFRNLQKLKKLGLANNKLSTFPIPLTKLENLEILDLTNNQIASITPEIGSMKNLKTLVLVNNKITSLPPEFFTLKNLEKIYLEGNPINANDIELLKKTFKKAEIGF